MNKPLALWQQSPALLFSSERLYARRAALVDRHFLLKLFSDQANAHLGAPQSISEDLLEERITRQTNTHWWLLLRTQENSQNIGFASIDCPKDAKNFIRPEISIAIERPSQGIGYGKEAARSLIDFVFKTSIANELPHAVIAQAKPTHAPSIKTLKSLGFTRTLALLDQDETFWTERTKTHRFEVMRSTWQNPKQKLI